MTAREFGTISRFVFAGLLVVVCAGCTVHKWVPEEDLEAERQSRQVFQARQEHLLKELKKQIGVQGELEEKLAVADRKLQRFGTDNQALKEKLHAESVV